MDRVVAVVAGRVVGGVARYEGGAVVVGRGGSGGGEDGLLSRLIAAEVFDVVVFLRGGGDRLHTTLHNRRSRTLQRIMPIHGPQLRDLLVQDLEQPLGDVVFHILDEPEPAREGRDRVHAILGEGALEDVEADGAGVAEDEPGNVLARVVGDHVGDDFVLEEGEDAVLAGDGGAVGPECVGRAPVGVVEAELFADGGYLGGDVEAMGGREGCVVEGGVVVEGEEVVVDVAAGEGGGGGGGGDVGLGSWE